MVSKQVGAIFVILGGVFYLIGSFLGGAIAAFWRDIVSLANNPFGATTYPTSASPTGYAVLAFGLFCAVMIITGGALINSDSPGRRKAGGGLALGMMVIGALPDVGGLLIGFLFVLVGSVVGLTYKPNPPDIGVGMMQEPLAAARGSQRSASFQVNGQQSASGTYCIKCGKGLYEGAMFCKYCGSPVPQ